MSFAADRNLLFGTLALQMDFVDRGPLIAAMKAWVSEKATPLGQILLRQQALGANEHAVLEDLVEKHLAQHGNDPGLSLAAASSIASVRDELQRITDPDIDASLAHLSRDRWDEDPSAQSDASVGESTSGGQRFRILRPHAKGGLGEVFVAEDGELHREVALKQIQSQYADDPSSRSRFILEAEVTGGLEHPGIVPIYGLGADAAGRPFYAMRFIRGNSLKDAIERFHSAESAQLNIGERTLQFRKLLGRFIDVCNAIEYAHSRGVLHRDLKPDNIMLGKYGESLVVDWGLAKSIGRPDLDYSVGEQTLHPASAPELSQTRQGSVLGTLPYMSAEQAAGRHNELGPASDVYSLGATLYCLLTGQTPLSDGSCQDVEEALRRVQHGDITPPRKIRSDVPKPLDAICRKAMSIDPDDRYPSPRTLADDVEHWLADEPTIAQPESFSDRLSRVARRHRSAALATTGAAILIAVVASVAAMLVSRLARENADLFRSEQQAHNAAEQLAKEKTDLARSEQQAREKAEQLAEERRRLVISERDSREEAVKSANSEKLEREKAERLAEEKTELALSEQQARKEAEQLAQEKTKLAESERSNREKADKLAEFLIGAIQPEDPTRFTGATFFAPKANAWEFKVIEMLRVEIRRARAELSELPLAQAAVLDSMGDVCRQLAMFTDSERFLNEALQIRRKRLDPNDPDLATSCFHTAWYYHERGNFEKAKPLYLEALEIREKLPNGQALVADTLQNLAWLHYYDDGSPEEVDACFAKALGIREQLLEQAPTDRRKVLLRNVAFTKLGMAAAAGQARILKAKRIASDPVLRQQLIELGHEKLADALAHFIKAGDAKFFNEPAKAIDELKKSLALIQGAGKAETVLAGPVYLELVHASTRLNRFQEAERFYRAAMVIVRRDQLLQIPKQADKINTIGEVLRKLGKAPEAQELWEEYLAAQKFRFGERHRFYAEADAAYRTFRAARPAK